MVHPSRELAKPERRQNLKGNNVKEMKKIQVLVGRKSMLVSLASSRVRSPITNRRAGKEG
jgi:hypothetical protein